VTREMSKHLLYQHREPPVERSDLSTAEMIDSHKRKEIKYTNNNIWKIMNKESKASSTEEMAFAVSLFENFLSNIGFRLKDEEKDYYAEENPVFRDYLIHLGKQRKVAYSTELHQEWRECLTAAVYISPLLEVEFEETPEPPARCEKEIDPILKQGVAMNRALLGNLIKSYIKDNDLTITAL
jgi:hypothetical protein